MNLVFIYGPPATGKLTIGIKVADSTGYKLFHNHLTIDVAKELYPNFDSQMFGLTSKLRLTTFEYAAQQNTNIIFTYVFEDDETDNLFVKNTVDILSKNDSVVHFVQLSAPVDILAERVKDESRKELKKLSDSEHLRAKLENYNFNASVHYDDVLRIDTSKCSPEQSAELIIEHFGLERTA